MSEQKKLPVTICCSGGIDSTALIHYYLSLGHSIRSIHFNYGQPAFVAECKALLKISEYYEIHITTTEILPVIQPTLSGEYFGRNSLFVLSAVNCFSQKNGLIALGIHQNTAYYDCTRSFIEHLQDILDGYLGGAIIIDAPFVDFAKQDIVSYCRQENIPINLTFSCDKRSDKPCGKCSSLGLTQKQGNGHN